MEKKLLNTFDKELLLKDICARLPYGIKASYYGTEEERETWDEIESVTLDGYVDIGQYNLPIERIKPYLLPLSSMTKEQKTECFKGTSLELSKYDEIYGYSEYTDLECYLKVIDWLNAHYFDYRGLIEKELAIDATGLSIYK